ncbi:MAG: hypothetical protein ACO3C4_01740 [Candidatus Limnocylindrus sp.]
MTLQASGEITIAQINAEFGLGNNLNAYRGVTWYTDAGGSGTFSSGAIAMSDFYSKRATSPASVAISNQLAANYSKSGIGGGATATYRLANSGQASATNLSGTLVAISGEWLVAGTASQFDARMTPTGSGSGGSTGGTFSSWVNLGTTQDWTLSATNNFASRQFTLEIRLSSSGAVLDTATIDFEVDSAP